MQRYTSIVYHQSEVPPDLVEEDWTNLTQAVRDLMRINEELVSAHVWRCLLTDSLAMSFIIEVDAENPEEAREQIVPLAKLYLTTAMSLAGIDQDLPTTE